MSPIWLSGLVYLPPYIWPVSGKPCLLLLKNSQYKGSAYRENPPRY